jgi:hypothetical protein
MRPAVGFALKTENGDYLCGITRYGRPLVHDRQRHAIRWEESSHAYSMGQLIGMRVVRLVAKKAPPLASKGEVAK